MPKRLNRAIELLEAGQPVFPTSAGQLTYENGKQMAGTYADIILVDFEHGAFDVVGLHQFIRGLVDGGPTPSGHRIPCVISTLPSNCRTRDEVIANQWQIRQVLTAGVMGVSAYARSPGVRRTGVRRRREVRVADHRGWERPGAGPTGWRRPAYSGGNLGPRSGRIHAIGRSLAVEPGRRIASRPEDRGPGRHGQCRPDSRRAGYCVRGMGAGRYGHVSRVCRRPRPAVSRGHGPGARDDQVGLRPQRGEVLQFVERSHESR